MNHQEALLNQVNEILQENPSYEPLASYPVFDVLGVSRKEVIMCRFLADLLKPEGAHQMGTLFLRTFLTQVLKMELPPETLDETDREINCETLLRNSRIMPEYVIDDARRIDIVIQNSRFFIPIEVKIYAGEQQSQCYDYYECAVRHDPEARVVYLTRFGTPPSEYSRRKKADDPAEKAGAGEASEAKGMQEADRLLPLDKIKCISWGGDICGWLAGLLSDLHGETNLLVMQYMDAIHEFAEERDVRIMKETMELLLNSQQNFSAGVEIERQMKKAKLALFDTARQAEAKYNGYQVAEVTPGMQKEAAQFLNADILNPEDWWLVYCYPNGKQMPKTYADVPNFKEMNACAAALVEEERRKEFVRDAIRVFETELLGHLVR